MVLAAIGLIGLVVAPMWASTASDSNRSVCFNNLRLIGRGVQTWAGETSQHEPPWWVRISDGGTWPAAGTSKGAIAWYEYSILSNELATPKILACPGDNGVKPAQEWNVYTSSGYRGKATSYNLGIHSVTESPRAFLCGDLNLRFDYAVASGCAAGVTGFFGVSLISNTALAWTNGVSHGDRGHALLNDGSVEFTSTPRVRQLIFSPEADGFNGGGSHFMSAR